MRTNCVNDAPGQRYMTARRALGAANLRRELNDVCQQLYTRAGPNGIVLGFLLSKIWDQLKRVRG